jgi:hypothetical protein
MLLNTTAPQEIADEASLRPARRDTIGARPHLATDYYRARHILAGQIC